MYLNERTALMEIELKSDTLQYLCDIFSQVPRSPNYVKATNYFNKLLKRGWVFVSDIEDFLLVLDNRLCGSIFRSHDLFRQFDIPIESVCSRPKLIASSTLSFHAMRPEYFVYYLIQLERIGFQVDAQRFVDKLRPAITQRSKDRFTIAELEIFWYAKTRFKNDDMLLVSDRSNEFYNDPDQMRKLPNGFKVSFYHDEQKETLQMLRIRAPKFRKRAKPVSVTCKKCGYEWERGDPESSLLHRREHARRMNCLDPKPLTKMLIELGEKGSEAEIVTWTSEKWKHKEMYRRALAFKWELRFDFTQWSSDGNEDPDAHGFLFTGEAGEIVGACAFRDRSTKDKKRWGLQWVWICPKERRKGHLDKRWPIFRKRFGDFVVESPVSEAMQAFLRKHGDTELTRG